MTVLCSSCKDPLGMADGRIRTNQIQAKSIPSYDAIYARLGSRKVWLADRSAPELVVSEENFVFCTFKRRLADVEMHGSKSREGRGEGGELNVQILSVTLWHQIKADQHKGIAVTLTLGGGGGGGKMTTKVRKGPGEEERYVGRSFHAKLQCHV